METDEHEFSCGRYVQTPAEHRQDCRRLKTLKRKIENAIPRSTLCVDDASEWNGHWRVPIALPTRVMEQHFLIIRNYGARLEVEEAFGDDQNLYTHHVVIPKSRHLLRAWSTAEKVLAIISTLGFFCVSAYLVQHVRQLYAKALG